jgi:hypothetical protein
MRSWLVLALVACSHPAPAPNEPANRKPATVASIGHDNAEELCCCELAPPNDPSTRFESRASACRLGTPATPAGTCVAWTGCGFSTGAHRTVTDRPELAARVKVPPGSCCCDVDGAFRVVGAATCGTNGTCLDADWCVPDGRSPPPVTSPGPWIDRCVQVADHFEPWRKNPDWANEVSPRARLIADCQRDRWSIALQDCLLAANGPLDLDSCM